MSENCDECYHRDELTGSCTNDIEECTEGSQFVRQVSPEDMYKLLFMMIFKVGGEVSVPIKQLDDFEDGWVIDLGYDPDNKKFVFTTNPQPEEEKPEMILVPKKLLKRQRKRGILYPN